ncbi:Molecular chaperone regulator BAG [Gracilaria domingensis]|nr:Molecular chaperone regulator BAG [Gracilaria domingensis]
MSTQNVSQPSQLTLMFNRKTYKVPIRKTVEDLQTDIERLTSIPPEEQTVLIKGKKFVLASTNADLADIGVTGRCKAMLIHSAPSGSPSISISPALRSVRSCSGKVAKLSKDLSEVRQSMNKHLQGFLDASMTKEALERDRKGLRVIEEECMRVLEQLDSLGTGDGRDAESVRTERRSAVAQVQSILRDIDSVSEDIQTFQIDKHGEIEARRGKS